MNDTLQTSSAALTDLVVVNDFSEKKEKAADFAEYVTLTDDNRISHIIDLLKKAAKNHWHRENSQRFKRFICYQIFIF